jgi:glycosyltransferase involved in cell wall biosynthesis
MLKDEKVRGDVRSRQLVYAEKLSSLNLIVYSPKKEGLQEQSWTEKLRVYPTNSTHKAFFILDAYRVASRICRERKIDAITTEDPFTCGVVGWLLKRRFKVPLNVQVHIDFYDNPYWMSLRPVNQLFNRIGKFIIKQADTLRCGTHVEKRKLAVSGVDPERINVIPVNSEIKKFQKGNGGPVREQFLNGRYDRMVLFTGRLVKQKDIPTLLEAFSRVLAKTPKTLLLIVGKGAEEQALKRRAEELKLTDNVRFTGSIPIEAVPDYLAACDVYAVSSIYEGTCIAMTEAMSAGKPVVVTRFAGAEDLVEDKRTGMLVDIKDHASFADKILYLFDHPQEAVEMGERAAERIEGVFADDRNIDLVIGMWIKTARDRR